MRELFVKSIPLKDVITDLANEMNTSMEIDCDEYILNIPQTHGTGIIKGINFNNNFGLIAYDCTFHDDITIHFTISKIHPLKFIYCSKGSLQHKFHEEDTLHEINEFENIIVASTANNGHVLIFKKDCEAKINSLEIDRKEFNYKLDCEIEKLDKRIINLFNDDKAKSLFFHRSNFSLEMADCINQINNSNSKELVRKLFLEGKSLEILSFQIQELINDLSDNPKQVLRKADIEKVHLAAKILKQELSSPLTIKNLAKKVGTNTTKLQEGFNFLFKTSVNNYLKKIRLEFAKEQLIIGELNISEIASRIGIINKSYFSRLFKETYGLNPKELSKQLKVKKAN